ncbi:MAG: GGDEF domain-containing protein [Monoglobales bacterium]
MKKYIIAGLYVFCSVALLFAIYLSVIHAPEMRATILVATFCVVPLSFVDRPSHMNIFIVFWFVVHTVLAFILKPTYALDDMINCLCFAILGCYIGNIMVWVRIEGYDLHRLLTIEKETDVLTGLYNRHKLFETLVDLETKDSEKPSGIIMIDVDHFKEFNDSFGHFAGDKCLSSLGSVLKKFKENFNVDFYRYGGDEFVAMLYGYNEKELLTVAESLRIAVQNTDFDGLDATVSIGAVYCGGEQVRNYENIIDRADKAVYAAKSAGRNKMCWETT